eukprot:scaffold553_cov97-Isochrysis_galbana.AAC.1
MDDSTIPTPKPHTQHQHLHSHDSQAPHSRQSSARLSACALTAWLIDADHLVVPSFGGCWGSASIFRKF